MRWPFSFEDVGPTVLILVTILVVAWGVVASFTDPVIGFTIWEDGRIKTIIEGGPAAGRVSRDDYVISVNGAPSTAADTKDYGAHVGDVLTFELRDETGRIREEKITVIDAPPDVIGKRLSIPFIASVYALSGAFVQALTRKSNRNALVGTLFLVFMSMVAIYLASTNVSSSGGSIALNNISGFVLGVVAVHFHAVFPRPVLAYGLVRVVVRIVYVLVAVISILITVAYVLGRDVSQFGVFLNVYLAVSAVSVILALVIPIFRSPNKEERHLRLIVIGSGIMGVLPVLLLSYVPRFLAPEYYVEVAISTLPMALVPVGYAYAVLRFRLVELDTHISRAIGFQVSLFLMALVLGLTLAVMRLVGWTPDKPAFLLSMLAVTTLLSVSFDHARRRIQSGIDRLFDRPFVVFREALRSVDQTLATTTNASEWAQTLCTQFADALSVRPVALLYRDGQAFRVATHDPASALASLATEFDVLSPLLVHLESRVAPDEGHLLRTNLASSSLPDAERHWLTCPALSLWWPIVAHSTLQAVLVFGSKDAGFTPEDVEMVALASHQIGASLENAQFARELEQLSRASLQARDDERRRVSRELHDHIVQPLIGLNYALGALRDIPAAADARSQVRDLIDHVRRISADLRPPALDEVGLSAAARGLSRSVAREASLVIDFAVVPSDDLDVPEPLASTFYSALREALSNIRKHAQATRVSVLLESHPDGLTLVVHDDGVGFSPPSRLGLLAPTGHFGLLGMQERMAALGGTLNLHTQPGSGTRLEFRAPLSTNGREA